MNDKNNCQHKKMSLGACMLKRIFDVICSLGSYIACFFDNIFLYKT